MFVHYPVGRPTTKLCHVPVAGVFQPLDSHLKPGGFFMRLKDDSSTARAVNLETGEIEPFHPSSRVVHWKGAGLNLELVEGVI